MKDLDEQITWTLLHYGGWCCEQIEASDTDKQFHEAKAKIKQLIVQARKEEIKRQLDFVGRNSSTDSLLGLSDRLSELEAEL